MTDLDSSRLAAPSFFDAPAGTRDQRPRVLYLTHHLPWPERSGGRIREAQLLQRLADRFAIEVVAISKTPEHDRAAVDPARAAGVEPRIFAAERGPLLAGPLARRHGSKPARAYLNRRLSCPHTLVHVEGHYLFHLLPQPARRRAIVVEHNVESSLLTQAAEAAASFRDRAALTKQALRTRWTERAVWQTADVVGAVTEEDARAIGHAAPHADVRLLPNGCDHVERASVHAGSARGNHLLFIGNFSYAPNLDAARVLITEIFPAVTRQRPGTTLAVVGADPPAWLARAAQSDARITVTGWVPDLADCLDSADVVVCPLRIGGGVKVKVLEALQRAKAVVTTPVGAQGLDRIHESPVIVRETAAALADACVWLLDSPEARRAQERHALAAARSLPTWNDAAEALAACWRATANVLSAVGSYRGDGWRAAP